MRPDPHHELEQAIFVSPTPRYEDRLLLPGKFSAFDAFSEARPVNFSARRL